MNVRYVDFPIPANMDIVGNKVLIISWKKDVSCVLIHSVEIASSMRTYFDSV